MRACEQNWPAQGESSSTGSSENVATISSSRSFITLCTPFSHDSLITVWFKNRGVLRIHACLAEGRANGPCTQSAGAGGEWNRSQQPRDHHNRKGVCQARNAGPDEHNARRGITTDGGAEWPGTTQFDQRTNSRRST